MMLIHLHKTLITNYNDVLCVRPSIIWFEGKGVVTVSTQTV